MYGEVTRWDDGLITGALSLEAMRDGQDRGEVRCVWMSVLSWTVSCSVQQLRANATVTISMCTGTVM